MTQSEERPGRWWARSVAACSSVAVVAGLVAVVSAAIDADRAGPADPAAVAGPAAAAGGTAPSTTRAPGTASTRAAVAAAEPARADPAGIVDRATESVLRAAPGWRPVGGQELVPVVPGRFSTTLAAGDRAVVMVGGLTPAARRDLGAEARRLAGAFSEGVAPGGGRVVTLSDQAGTLDGQPAWTTLRRVADGTLVRVTTVAAAPGRAQGRTLLAVVRPGPEQAGDARAAEGIVRSLATAPGPTGR